MLLLVSEPVKGYSLYLAAWIPNNYKTKAKNKQEQQSYTSR